jgi:RND family efflux transporter MFP subunit
MNVRLPRPGLLIGLLTASFAAPAADARQAPTVPVSKPVVRQVVDHEDFTGRTEALQSVEVRPRVTGFLREIAFQEGALVKEGDLLFVIDPQPYQAERDAAVARVALAVVVLRRAEAGEDQKAVEEARARLRAEQAKADVAALNLGFTRIRAPISGRVGRRLVVQGNLVEADKTVLTTIVSNDPLGVVLFDMDERSLLRLTVDARDGKWVLRRPWWRNAVAPALVLGFANEDGFPHAGKLDVVDNRVDPQTGTVRCRATFANPKGLPPGLFARVRLTMGAPYSALLVAEKAVQSDQGRKSVWVLSADNRVEVRPVTLGPLQEDGLRVIAEGLRPDDRVIVGKWSELRPGLTVKPEAVEMPRR